MKDDAKILFNLKCYLESLLASGQDKIFYNDLLNDEKTIDCINAIEDLLKERKKYTILLTDKEYRKVIENAQKDIAEQKDKRIQELEEYIAIAPNLDEMTATKYIVIQEEAYIRGKAEEQQKAEQIIRENYIPKQVVIDKMKENKQILDETNNGDIRERLYIENDILQELLGGGK